MAVTSLDENERLAALKKVDEILQEDAPYITLAWMNTILAYNSKLNMGEAQDFLCGDVNFQIRYFYFE